MEHYLDGYVSVLKMFELGGLGKDNCFLGAKEEGSGINNKITRTGTWFICELQEYINFYKKKTQSYNKPYKDQKHRITN